MPVVNLDTDYDLAEASAVIGIHRETLRLLVRDGKIPGAYRVGGVWRIHRLTLDAWRTASRPNHPRPMCGVG